MQKTPDIIILGAGAAGLMAAYELSKKGRKVLILEAQNRIGGRIWPLNENEFGYPAQGGAEFTHGEVPITKDLLKKAGLNHVTIPDDSEIKFFNNGKIFNGYFITEDPEFLKYKNEIRKKLGELKDDISIIDFLNKYFIDDKYKDLRSLIISMTGSYDIADPKRISTFYIKNSWLGENEWMQGRIKEGYGAMINFLELECKNNNTEILLNKPVTDIIFMSDSVKVICNDKSEYNAPKSIITASPPTVGQINFTPSISHKIKMMNSIGFGQAIKVVIRFKDYWWLKLNGHIGNKTIFILCDGGYFSGWWTQYPENIPVLTGWITGDKANELKEKNQENVFDLGIDSLSDIFKINRNIITKNLNNYEVVNWPNNPYIRGAYSYVVANSEKTYTDLREPIDSKIYFAGEALSDIETVSTVEGALSSGKHVADQIIKQAKLI